MSHSTEPKEGWKGKLHREMVAYWINFAYLAVFFGAFAWYRRLTLEEYRIAYLNYGVALIEALVLAKVILIGDAFRLGRKAESGPLIYPTLYKAVVFTVWVGVFKLIEHMLGGLVHGKGFAGGFASLRAEGADAFLAQCLVTFFAFVPYFAFRELGRTLGEGRIAELFFRRPLPTAPAPINGAVSRNMAN